MSRVTSPQTRKWSILSSARRGAIEVLLVAALAVLGPAVWFAWSTVNELTQEIEAGRLRLARLAATQADRVVTETFFELELMAQFVGLETDKLPLQSQVASLRTIYARAASFHSGALLLDADGDIVVEEPPGRLRGLNLGRVIASVSNASDRAISEPWIDPASGHAIAALSLPIFSPDGSRVGSMVGLLDLAEPLVSDLILPAARLGLSGHADLVDERGTVLASTEPGQVLTPGDHPDFYARAALDRAPRVETVDHSPEPNSLDQSTRHVMAYASLQNAPWGVAMGASEKETMEPVRRLRLRLLVLALASSVTLLLVTALAVRHIPSREDG